MLQDYALTTFVTLAVVVDPIGLAPTFLSITQGLSKPAQRGIGGRAAIIAAAILIATALGGTWLLTRLGIGLPPPEKTIPNKREKSAKHKKTLGDLLAPE